MFVGRLSRRSVLLATSAFAVTACVSAPASTAPAPQLQPSLTQLSRFVGRWRGAGKGEPGDSSVLRSYTPVLAGRFIEVRNTSAYLPQAANPKGEINDHVGYLSFDNARKLFVLRQFHVEGFVNQYAATTPDFAGDRLVFASEAFENIPASMKARETYGFTSPNTFEETFEIAEDGVSFQVYSRNTLTRI